MKRKFLVGLLIFLYSGLSAQPGSGEEPSACSELTIYLIPSKVKYDWSSPHSLYASLKKNFMRNIFNRQSYILGHAFMELSTPGDTPAIFTGMRATCREQSKRMLFRDHYGMAILGTGLEGRLQEPDELEREMHKFSKKGNMTFIRVKVNEEAAARMMEYYNAYALRLDSIEDHACYGGVFWPRYYGEGAGCSAFVVSFLDIAGLMRQDFDQWRVEIKIPMDLIGGPYNPGQEVKMRDVRKRKQWTESMQCPKEEYESFWIFDPTLMAEWVKENYNSPGNLQDMKAVPVKINKSVGLEFDAREVPVPDESLFMQRSEPSIFLPK